MEKDGWSLNDKMCTALIKACGEQGDAVSAAFYFHRQITSYGYVSHTICNMLYSTFITALGKSGWIGAAHSYFKEMLDKGIQPDLVTYTAMIDTLNHPDWNRIALEYIDLMFKKFPVITSDITYYVVIGVYVEAGKFDKAMQVAEIARFDLRLDQEHEFDCHYHSHGLACLKLYNYLSKKKNFMEISVITGIGLHSNSGQYFEMKNKIKNLINTYFPYLDIIDHGGMIRIVKYPN
jgi:pentatricopeptide repeat protein